MALMQSRSILYIEHLYKTCVGNEFAKLLASLVDLYVKDAFDTAYREHTSTEGVSKYLKQSIAGFLIHKDKPYDKDDDIIKATSFEVISTLRDVLKTSSF